MKSDQSLKPICLYDNGSPEFYFSLFFKWEKHHLPHTNVDGLLVFVPDDQK